MSTLYAEVEHLLKNTGLIKVQIDDFTFSLDLSFRHERAYAAKLILDVQHPQCDIDEFIIRRVMRTGDRVLDAGGNIGFTAWQMFKAGASEVVSLEPVPAIYERLRSLRNPGFHAVNMAIASTTGTRQLFLSMAHNQGATLEKAMTTVFPSVFGECPETINVPLTTIDALTLQFGGFDVWKLDIEGSETAALLGARTALANNPPRIIFAELYDEFRADFLRIVNQTHAHAYRAFIDRGTYGLILTDPDTPNGTDFHTTSPMYVFSRQSLL
jgi:FkbM family methyltransferase